MAVRVWLSHTFARVVHAPFVVTAFMRSEATSGRPDPMNRVTTSPYEQCRLGNCRTEIAAQNVGGKCHVRSRSPSRFVWPWTTRPDWLRGVRTRHGDGRGRGRRQVSAGPVARRIVSNTLVLGVVAGRALVRPQLLDHPVRLAVAESLRLPRLQPQKLQPSNAEPFPLDSVSLRLHSVSLRLDRIAEPQLEPFPPQRHAFEWADDPSADVRQQAEPPSPDPHRALVGLVGTFGSGLERAVGRPPHHRGPQREPAEFADDQPSQRNSIESLGPPFRAVELSARGQPAVAEPGHHGSAGLPPVGRPAFAHRRSQAA